MQKIITPLPIQLGSRTAGTNSLGLYLDANKLLGGNQNPADGTAITTGANAWRDLSGSNNIAAQGTALNQPLFKNNITNGNDMVLFDGSDDVLQVETSVSLDDLFANGGFTLFAVKPTGMGGGPSGGQGRLFSQGGGNSYQYIIDQSGSNCKFGFHRAFATDGEWLTNNRVITLNAVNIIGVSYNSSSASNDPIFYINSSTAAAITETSTPTGSPAATSLIRIGNSATTSRTWAGYMGDILMFKDALNAGQIGSLMEWAARKYGVTLS